MMLILAYDSYFEKKDSQVILVKKCPKDSQPLRIMILIKKMSVCLWKKISDWTIIYARFQSWKW